MQLYLLVLLRNRKHSKVAASTTPTRTPITMPVMAPRVACIVFFWWRERGKREGVKAQVHS